MKTLKTLECSNCGAEARVMRGTWRLKEISLRNVVLQGVEIARCGKCGNEDLVLRRMGALMRALAQAVALKPCRLSGDEVRFLRKFLGLTAERFARILHVDRTTLSKWENGEDPVGEQSDLLIRLLVAALSPELRGKLHDVVAHLPNVRESRRRLRYEVNADTMEYEYA